MKKTFIFYNDWIDYTEEMTLEEKGLFLESILLFQQWKEIKKDLWGIKFIWSRVKKQLEDDNYKWKNEIEKRKKAGKLWWLAKASKWKQVLASASKWKQLLADNVNVNVNDNVNNVNNISKDIEQSSKIIKKDNRVLEIDLIIETLKELNWWIIDDKVQAQRRYWKHIKTKLDKMSWFNWDYVWFIKYIYKNSDEYRKQYFRSAEKFYYNIAWIIAWIKTNMKTKIKTVSI